MRGPGWASVILVSMAISAAVSMTVQWAGDTGRLDALWQGHRVEASSGAAALGRSVPQLIGLPRKLAAELLKSRDLLLVVREQREDPDLPKGSVLSQDPLPGSEMAPGGQVSVVLSSGLIERVAVPPLEGLSLAEARDKLQAAGLELGSVEGPEGGDERLVASSLPATGMKVTEGSEVSVRTELATVEVPKVVGMNVRKATEAIEEAGLKVGKVRYHFDDLRPFWAVLSQEPEAGTQAKLGSEVDLVRNEE